MRIIDDVLGKKLPICILGDGLSGRGAAYLLDKLGHNNYEFFSESGKLLSAADIHRFAIFIVSPGFPPHHKWLKAIYLSKKRWFGELDFASMFFDGKIIAVTGTNGKTSTTEWLTMLFNMGGKKAFSAGNNEKPLSGAIADLECAKDICVCEVSSYQASTMRFFNPDSVIWTNFDEDHINYHRTLFAYFIAKYRLIKLCKKKTKCWTGQWLRVWLNKFRVSHEGIIFSKSFEALDNELLFSMGQRNNFGIIRQYWLDNALDERLLDLSLAEFKPPKHRLTNFAEFNNMRFWNDSKATNSNAVIAALDSFANSQRVVIILGGKSKGENIVEFLNSILKYSNLKEILLIGETGVILKNLLEQRKSEVAFRYFMNLDLAVKYCAVYSNKDCDIVLSPGFASFDQFKNYAERGTVFENSVFMLKNDLNVLEI